MDPWEVAAKASESSGSNASYIRLKAGEFVECVFRGAPIHSIKSLRMLTNIQNLVKEDP